MELRATHYTASRGKNGFSKMQFFIDSNYIVYVAKAVEELFSSLAFCRSKTAYFLFPGNCSYGR